MWLHCDAVVSNLMAGPHWSRSRSRRQCGRDLNVRVTLNLTDRDWQKWTRYRMMLKNNVLIMFSSEKKSTKTVSNHTWYLLSFAIQHEHAFICHHIGRYNYNFVSVNRHYCWSICKCRCVCLTTCRWWELWVWDRTAECMMCGRTSRMSASALSSRLSLTVANARRMSSWCAALFVVDNEVTTAVHIKLNRF